jgi:tetratricopeptide (TPR) repeat protein
MRSIARALKVTDALTPDSDDSALLSDWLTNEVEGRWFIVLDDLQSVRSPTHLVSSGSLEYAVSRLLDRLSTRNHGSLLITTRDLGSARSVVKDHEDHFHVMPMELEESRALLENMMDKQLEPDDYSYLKDLGSMLGNSPLALATIGQQMRRRQISIKEIVEQYNESVASIPRASHRSTSYRDPITSMFESTLAGLTHTSIELLSFMSLCHCDSIPEVLLRCFRGVGRMGAGVSHQAAGDDKDLFRVVAKRGEVSYIDVAHSTHPQYPSLASSAITGTDQSLHLEDQIKELMSFALIAQAADPKSPDGERTFCMHRLIKHTILDRLDSRGDLESCKSNYLKCLDSIVPHDTTRLHWREYALIYPHVTEATRMKYDDMHLSLLGSITYRTAKFALRRGAVSEAESMTLASWTGRSESLGPEALESLQSALLLAETRTLQGRLAEAAEIEVRVLEAFKRLLGHAHSSTLEVQTNLASTYVQLGLFDNARVLQIEALEELKASFGENHPLSLSGQSVLADIYRRDKRLVEAQKLEEHAIERRRVVLGSEHPDTLHSMENLASTLQDQGRLEEATALREDNLSTYQKCLGSSHPDTLACATNLAATYGLQGRMSEAADLLTATLETLQSVLGLEHPFVLVVTERLALIQWKLRPTSEAYRDMSQCAAKSSEVLGFDHPDTARRHEQLELWRRTEPGYCRGD